MSLQGEQIKYIGTFSVTTTIPSLKTATDSIMQNLISLLLHSRIILHLLSYFLVVLPIPICF